MMLLNSIDPFRSMALFFIWKTPKSDWRAKRSTTNMEVILKFYREIQIIILTKQGSNIFFSGADLKPSVLKIVSRVKKREMPHGSRRTAVLSGLQTACWFLKTVNYCTARVSSEKNSNWKTTDSAMENFNITITKSAWNIAQQDAIKLSDYKAVPAWTIKQFESLNSRPVIRVSVFPSC